MSASTWITKEEILENEQLWREERDNPELPVSGQDLRAVGVTPGGIESDISTGEDLAGSELGGAEVDAGAGPSTAPTTVAPTTPAAGPAG